ncbi:MAG: FkbM family methyltransferase [Sphingobacteriaceae bacterium]
MQRKDKIKLAFSRNWKFPGQERLSHWLKPSADFKKSFKNGIAWLNNEPIAIYTSADSYIEWTIVSTGTYEAEIEKLIAISLKEGDVALDIGANIGLQSLRMSNQVGASGNVIAFEPLPYLQEKLLSNCRLNHARNIQLMPFALSDEPGSFHYLIDESSWNQGTFSLGYPALGNTSCLVEVKVADHLKEIQQLKRLDLIKIDVEGFEFPVLKGLKNTLCKFSPRIIFEYDVNYWKANEHLIQECAAFLHQLNYDLYQINNIGCELITDSEMIEGGNLFCIPNAKG